MFVQNNLKGRLLLVLVIFAALLIYQYWHFKPVEPLNIALSYERASENKYSTWLLNSNKNLRFVNLSKIPRAALHQTLDTCDALLLTGGADIYPGRYGKENDTARCGTFDLERDTMEFAALDFALLKKMPVMGICRGLQLINVGLGGTLFIDLRTDHGSGELHRRGEEDWTRHRVTIEPNTLLYGIFGMDTVTVASNHHQGIEKVAADLTPLAHTSDGLVEAIGWKHGDGKSKLLAVQWHPEWAALAGNDANPLAKYFLNTAREFQQQKPD